MLISNFLENDFWTPPFPPPYQFCIWISNVTDGYSWSCCCCAWCGNSSPNNISPDNVSPKTFHPILGKITFHPITFPPIHPKRRTKLQELATVRRADPNWFRTERRSARMANLKTALQTFNTNFIKEFMFGLQEDA